MNRLRIDTVRLSTNTSLERCLRLCSSQGSQVTLSRGWPLRRQRTNLSYNRPERSREGQESTKGAGGKGARVINCHSFFFTPGRETRRTDHTTTEGTAERKMRQFATPAPFTPAPFRPFWEGNLNSRKLWQSGRQSKGTQTFVSRYLPVGWGFFQMKGRDSKISVCLLTPRESSKLSLRA